MEHIGNKLLTCIKLTAKWWLIQFLFVIIYGAIDYALGKMLFGWIPRVDFTLWGLWFGVTLNTILFAFWYAFYDKKRKWWIYIFPWFILLVLTLILRMGNSNFHWHPFDHYLLLAWVSPLFGITIQCIWFGMKHLFSINTKSRQ